MFILAGTSVAARMYCISHGILWDSSMMLRDIDQLRAAEDKVIVLISGWHKAYKHDEILTTARLQGFEVIQNEDDSSA